MKKQPKKPPNSSDPRPGRFWKAFRHLLRLSGFTLALILMLFLLHLVLIGLPEPLIQRITRSLHNSGIPLTVESITLSPYRGWVFHEVRLYSPHPDDLEPVIQTEKLYALAWPNQWTAPFSSGWNIKAHSREIAVSSELPWRDETRQRFGTVDLAKVHLHLTPGALDVIHSELKWGGYIFRVSGHFAFEKKQMATDAPPAQASRLGTRITIIADTLAALEFDKPPTSDIRFKIPVQPEQPTLTASIEASGLRRNGVNINRISASVTLRDGLLQIDPLLLSQTGEEQLTLSGQLNLTNQSAQLDIKNTLSAPDLSAVLPATFSDRLNLKLPGALDFETTLGPAPLTNLLSKITVDLQNAQAVRNDLSLSELSARIIRSDDRIDIQDIRTKANGGPLEGSASVYLASKAWNASLTGTVQPGPIGSLLGGASKEWIDRFHFTNTPPTIQVDLAHSGKKDSLRMNGFLSGQDFTCADLPFDTIEMTLAYSNRVFELTPLHLTHGSRQFTGTISTDADQKLAFFDVETGLEPPVIAQAIAPDHPTVLTNFVFTGPVQAKASGQVDFSGGTNHAFSGTLDAQDLTVKGFAVESFSSQIEAKGADLIFTNSTARLLGGSIKKSSAVFDLNFNDDTESWSLALNAENMDMPKVQAALNPDKKSGTAGQLSGQIHFTADGETGFWSSADGTGTVEIVNGRLAELPILSGFSKIIRTTLPAFSLFSLTTLYSEFTLDDGFVKIDDLQLGGTLLTVRASGSWSAEKGLNFIVLAEPFRQTPENKQWYHLHLWSADILKLGTARLFKLLEFRLTGPLDKPKWKMKKFPAKRLPGIGN